MDERHSDGTHGFVSHSLIIRFQTLRYRHTHCATVGYKVFTKPHGTSSCRTDRLVLHRDLGLKHARRSLSTVGGTHSGESTPLTTVLLSFTFILPPGTL